MNSFSSRVGSTPGSKQTHFHSRNIKRVLLEQSERQLSHLLTNGDDEDNNVHSIRIQALLGLSRIAMSYEHQSIAIRLSLAALRTMQQLPHAHYDMKLWLECKVMLARSLAGSHIDLSSAASSGYLDCVVQCEEGITQCEAVGDTELTVELHLTAALHAMSLEPCQLETVTNNCQVGQHLGVTLRSGIVLIVNCTHTYIRIHTKQRALELLESLPVLSPHTNLLRCQASLLLADVSCVAGVCGIETEMVDVFRGLGSMLTEQVIYLMFVSVNRCDRCLLCVPRFLFERKMCLTYIFLIDVCWLLVTSA